MKALRAILVGVLLWILIFIEISITMIGLKLSDLAVWIIHYILLIPFAILCAWIYYKKKNKLNGFLFGISILIVGIILDLIITVPLFIITQGGSYTDYLSNIYLLIGFVELIIITGIYSLLRKK